MMAGAMSLIAASAATAQRAEELNGPAPVLPLSEPQPAPRLVADPPVASALARGLAVIQYRAENLHIVPVFGPKALDVTPRIGHIHVTVDDAPWHWADASGEPLIIQGLPAGPHKVAIDLVDANHKPFERVIVAFVIPPKTGDEPSH